MEMTGRRIKRVGFLMQGKSRFVFTFHTQGKT